VAPYADPPAARDPCNPSLSSVFSGAERVAYLAGKSKNACPFRCRLRACAGAHGWVYTDEARPVAGTLLTEILSYDLKCPAFTLDHGGTLTDDAVDEPHKWEGLTEDKVGPPGDLLTEFSYLRPTDNA
jgi:hypothetical protein